MAGWSSSFFAQVTSPRRSATFVGLERIVGKVGGRKGTLVVQHAGTYADGTATAKLSVVEGSGSDDLASVTGDGEFTADPAGTLTLRLS